MTHAHYRCDCGHLIGTPTKKDAFEVSIVSCGECSKSWRISYPPSKLMGVFSEWRCPTCNGDKKSWCSDLRGCITKR